MKFEPRFHPFIIGLLFYSFPLFNVSAQDAATTPTLATQLPTTLTVFTQIPRAPVESSKNLLIPSTDVEPTTHSNLVTAIGPPQEISLDDLIFNTLQNNLDIKIERYSERIAKDSINREKGIYDPTISAGASLSDTTTQSEFDLSEIEETGGIEDFFSIGDTERDVREGDVNISQLLPSGGVISAGTFAQRRELNRRAAGLRLNPLYTRDYSITITQPVLQGLGPAITNAPIDIARLQHQIAQEQFRTQVINLVAEIMIAYWDLVFAINDAEVKQLSLEQARTLLRTNTIKYETGVLPRVDVLQAEAEVANREDQLIVAKQAIEDAQDRIKKLMNIEVSSTGWEANLVPRDPPHYVEYPITLNENIAQAKDYRPELRQAELNLEVSEIDETVARNQRLPQLDIFGSYGIQGIDNGLSNADDVARTQDFDFWSYGLQFSYPLRNRRARYAHKQAQKAMEQADVTIENVVDSIIQQVRISTRSIEANRARIKSTESSIRFEEAKLDAEMKRYDVGYATTFDLLDFQEDLANARSRYLQAVVNYNKSIIALERFKGTILETLGINIESVNPDLGDY